MKTSVVLLPINQLKNHEAVYQGQVRKLVREISRDGCLKNPVVADKKTKVLLDGHHRVAALKKLGVRKAPVFLVDYKSRRIKVYLRRKELMADLIKEAVVKVGLSDRVFPYKTTRHLLKSRPKNINVRIEKLL